MRHSRSKHFPFVNISDAKRPMGAFNRYASRLHLLNMLGLREGQRSKKRVTAEVAVSCRYQMPLIRLGRGRMTNLINYVHPQDPSK